MKWLREGGGKSLLTKKVGQESKEHCMFFLNWNNCCWICCLGYLVLICTGVRKPITGHSLCRDKEAFRGMGDWVAAGSKVGEKTIRNAFVCGAHRGQLRYCSLALSFVFAQLLARRGRLKPSILVLDKPLIHLDCSGSCTKFTLSWSYKICRQRNLKKLLKEWILWWGRMGRAVCDWMRVVKGNRRMLLLSASTNDAKTPPQSRFRD
jgi:hypothetical protein